MPCLSIFQESVLMDSIICISIYNDKCITNHYCYQRTSPTAILTVLIWHSDASSNKCKLPSAAIHNSELSSSTMVIAWIDWNLGSSTGIVHRPLFSPSTHIRQTRSHNASALYGFSHSICTEPSPSLRRMTSTLSRLSEDTKSRTLM